MKRCTALNSRGLPCRNRAAKGTDFCESHPPNRKLAPGVEKKNPGQVVSMTSPLVDPTPARALELALELVQCLELGDDMEFVKITELFDIIIGDPLTLEQTRAITSFGIKTATKTVHGAREPDWTSRQRLMAELRHQSKWDDAPPAEAPPENMVVVRMPCPLNNCPLRAPDYEETG